MIPSLSGKITSFYISKGVIPKEGYEIYAYSFEILLASIDNFGAICLFSALANAIIETFFYLLGFVPLRQFMGGYHAKSHLKCFITLMLAYGAFLCALKFMPARWQGAMISAAIPFSAISAFALAPAGHKGKPLSKNEQATFKRKSRIAVICCSLAIGALYLPAATRAHAFAIAMGALTAAASLIAAAVKRKMEESKNFKGSETLF